MTELLVAENLTRHYNIRLAGGLLGKRAVLKAVDGVSFSLHRGKTLGIVGESGCGKTTTANMAIGLVPPSDGRVLYRGKALPAKMNGEWRQLRSQMQMVFQDPLAALDRHLTIGYQVAEPLVIHRRGTLAQRKARVAELLDAVGLKPFIAERYPHELSGGQRQRVVLARALALNPSVVVCDEPVSALDVSIQAQVINLLNDLQEKLGLAYLFISHDLKVVQQVSDEVAVMYLGKIVEQGRPERLLRQPEHPYTQVLVNAVPTISGQKIASRNLPKGEPPSPIDVPSGCAFRTRCPWAQGLCAEVVPPLERLPDGDYVACHAVHGRIPKKASKATA